MQQTPDPTEEMVAQARGNIDRFSERLLHLFSFVPDDKLAWTPSATSRSSVHLVAHCAMVNRFFADVISGSLPDPMPSPEYFFKGLHDDAAKVSTRESAISMLKETATQLHNAFGTVNSGNAGATANSPFGPMPIPFWIAQGTEHIAGHIGQLEYLQTIWGDLDNHMG